MSKSFKNNSNSKQIKTCTLYIDGMHCASCEILIEKKILKQEGIEFVDASYKKDMVLVSYTKNHKPNIAKLNKEFREHGYAFSDQKIKNEKDPAFKIKDGVITANPQKIKKIVGLSSVAFLLFIGYRQLSGFGYAPSYLSQLEQTQNYLLFSATGLIAGFSTCAALVGGIILSMSKQWNEKYIDSDSTWVKSTPHIMFHIGRVVSFTIFGAILGTILPLLINLFGENSQNIFESSSYKNFIDLIVNFLILFLALQMLEVSWVKKLSPTMPKFITRQVANDSISNRLQPVLVGAYSFFVPCSFTLFVQSIALTSGSSLTGALILFFYSLGTLIPLSLISISSVGLNHKPHMTARFNYVIGVFLALVSFVNLTDLLMPDISRAKSTDLEITSTSADFVNLNAQGVQVMQITAQGDSYYSDDPRALRLGVPTVFEIDNQGAVGCYTFVKIPKLVENYLPLESGKNYLEFTPDKEGRFYLDCAMEMSPRPIEFIVINET